MIADLTCQRDVCLGELIIVKIRIETLDASLAHARWVVVPCSNCLHVLVNQAGIQHPVFIEIDT